MTPGAAQLVEKVHQRREAVLASQGIEPRQTFVPQPLGECVQRTVTPSTDERSCRLEPDAKGGIPFAGTPNI